VEYRQWWIEQRGKRNEFTVAMGDEIYRRTQQLYQKLYCARLHKNTIQKLYKYVTDLEQEWPVKGVMEPITQVEIDTLGDWVQDTWFIEEWQGITDENDYCEPWAKHLKGSTNKRALMYTEITLPLDICIRTSAKESDVKC
jgi:hypothetical protein